MSTVALTIQKVTDAGVVPNYQAAAAGNTYTVVDRQNPVLLHFKNAIAATCNVTITEPAVPGVREGPLTKVIVVPASGELVAGPFDPSTYSELLSFIVAAALTVAVVQTNTGDRKV